MKWLCIPSLLPTILCVWTLFIAFFFGFAERWNTFTSAIHCRADGSVIVSWLLPENYGTTKSNELWAPYSWISITLGFGGLTFAQAKTIDIFWDLCVGRGGQLLLVTLTYPLLRQCIRIVAKDCSVVLDTYCELAFRPCSLSSIILLVRRIRPCLGLGTLLRTLAMIILSAYIAIFPTLLSAMTSYQATSEPYTQDKDGNYFASSNLEELNGFYTLTDSPFGLGDDYPVPENSTVFLVLSDYLNTYEKAYYTIYNTTEPHFLGPQAAHDCSNMSVSSGTGICHAFFDCSTPSHCNITVSRYEDTLQADVWTTSISIQGETRNVTLTYGPEISTSSWNEFPDLNTYVNTWYSADTAEPRVYYQDEVYDWQKLMDSTICQPHNQYRWGFAYLFLFAFSLVTEAILLAALAVRLDVHRRRNGEAAQEHFTVLEDIATIAAALQKLLRDETSSLDDLSQDELTSLAKRHSRLIVRQDGKLELTQRVPSRRKRKAVFDAGSEGIELGEARTATWKGARYAAMPTQPYSKP